jgi:hypothetical protein
LLTTLIILFSYGCLVTGRRLRRRSIRKAGSMPIAIALTLLPLSLAARSILCAKSVILGITKPAAASTTLLPCY